MTQEFDYTALSEELDLILNQLQTGELDIDDSVRLYERGMKIVKQLENYLVTAENRVKKIKSAHSQ
jgi:exodeoxyribonuclease VII small subunit